MARQRVLALFDRVTKRELVPEEISSDSVPQGPLAGEDEREVKPQSSGLSPLRRFPERFSGQKGIKLLDGLTGGSNKQGEPVVMVVTPHRGSVNEIAKVSLVAASGKFIADR